MKTQVAMARCGEYDPAAVYAAVDQQVCVQCGICSHDCPQQVINNEGGILHVDYRKCIRCFCCQEFCPQGAITVGQGWLLKLIQ